MFRTQEKCLHPDLRFETDVISTEEGHVAGVYVHVVCTFCNFLVDAVRCNAEKKS